MRARYFDQVTGRFVSEDSSGFRGGDANLYRHVNNDPGNQVAGIDLASLLEPNTLTIRR